MKTIKLLKNVVISAALISTCSNLAFADGNAFTPLNFDDTTPYNAPKAMPKETPKASNPISNAVSKIMPAKTTAPESSEILNTASGDIPVGNDNIQNAILELDNAQVGIRNDLLEYKAKYADVDAQYKLIKNERNMLNKQVKSIEKRIRKIDKDKESLRKNML